MKTRNLIFVLLSIIIFSNCQDDKKDELIEERDYHPDIVSYPSGSLLKNVYTSYFEQSDPKFLTSEYEYDTNSRLVKVSYPIFDNGTIIGVGSCDLYKYNDTGQLLQKVYYNYNTDIPNDSLNIQTTSYTYNDEGLTTKELITYPEIGKSDYYLFHYNDKQLVKKEFFYRGTLQNTTLYEYKSGQLIKEKEYSDGNCYQYTNHTYQEGLLVMSASYQVSKDDDILLRVNRYYYDDNHHLVHKTWEEIALHSSMSSSSTWYEYE